MIMHSEDVHNRHTDTQTVTDKLVVTDGSVWIDTYAFHKTIPVFLSHVSLQIVICCREQSAVVIHKMHSAH